MSGIVIKEIPTEQVLAYKQFFAIGLLQDEDNFRISSADAEQSPFPTINQPDSFTLGAYLNNTITGVVSFTRDGHDREKLRHKGILFRMYVAAEFRGRGIAKALMETLLLRARNIADIEQINLTVVADNNIAKSFYESYGFASFASERHAIKWKGRYFTEDQMVLHLKN